jgi:membrane protein DedA with SNARE-associated domain
MTQWLMQDGYIALFVLLALGILCLPVPEETLMVLSGYLIATGKLPLLPTVVAAISGSICGITLSYLLGLTAGNYLLKKYGHWIGISELKIKQVQKWFNRIGKWALFIGYFIMGIRHFTGYVAGSTLLPYRVFALFAYAGALIWASTFLSVGYFFSDHLEHLIQLIHWNTVFIFMLGLLLIYLGWRSYKGRKNV